MSSGHLTPGRLARVPIHAVAVLRGAVMRRPPRAEIVPAPIEVSHVQARSRRRGFAAARASAQIPPVIVNNYVTSPSVQLSLQQRREPIVVRAVWFLFVGWWLSGLAIVAAYICFLFIVTIPVGISIIHQLPHIQTLRGRTREFQSQLANGQIVFREGTIGQRPFVQRVIWFAFIGWWLTGVWLGLAWLLSLMIIPLPLSIAMINRAPTMLTLHRY